MLLGFFTPLLLKFISLSFFISTFLSFFIAIFPLLLLHCLLYCSFLSLDEYILLFISRTPLMQVKVHYLSVIIIVITVTKVLCIVFTFSGPKDKLSFLASIFKKLPCRRTLLSHCACKHTNHKENCELCTT